ncbi:MAG: MATE family efflux transporter [Proteobacteria bacterium]|nr:MATE family efflux transporter [Burkholderiales bacterium]
MPNIRKVTEHSSQPLRPASRFGKDGVLRVDYRAMLVLAAPLFLNSSVQAVLNLTDTWFIGRISTEATAAMGAIYWLILGAVFLLGGVGMGVQTLVAQHYGAGRKHDAARSLWTGLWVALAIAPAFVALAWAGGPILRPFELPEPIETYALEYWWPRMIGAPLGVGLWAVSGFFNGIGRTRLTLILMIEVAVLNAPLNELFMFHFGWGVAGSAWATNVALVVGIVTALGLFLSRGIRHEYGSALHWRPDLARIGALLALGLPIGVAISVDVIGAALFQIMQVQLGAIDGAATQIVMMLTSLAFMPAVGIGLAGTTLVGQSIGSGDRDWAARVGNATIGLSVIYMGAVGLLLAVAGPWLIPLFVAREDPNFVATVTLATSLIWIAAIYQGFDALHLGSSFCLRGAGDTRFAALALLVLSWGLFVPLAHTLTFAPGQGWVEGVPLLGLGAVGGWIAITLYIGTLGITLLLRWRSGAWRRIQL